MAFTQLYRKLWEVATTGIPAACATTNTAGDMRGNGVCTWTTSGSKVRIRPFSSRTASRFQMALVADRTRPISAIWRLSTSIVSTTCPRWRSPSASRSIWMSAPPRVS